MPSQSDFYFTFQPLAGQSEFEVVSFELNEAISTPYQLNLELISFDDEVDFGQLLDKPVLFTIWRGKRALRYVHGLVSTFSQGDTGFCRTRYRALVEPMLARAGLRSNWRIFQQKTVPQILEIMLKRQGILHFQLNSSGEHQVREFCVQAGETDLAFIARLAAEEGFVYRFEHTPKQHMLLFTDRLLWLGQISRGVIQRDDDEGFDDDDIDPNQVLYRSNRGGDQAMPCLHRLRYSEQVRTARQVQRDYTFTNPAYRQEHRAEASDLKHQSTAYEYFDYPGRYKRDAVGVPFTATRITALRHDARIAEVEGDDVRLQPGLSFTLIEHPRDDLNVHWRVINVHHEGTQFTSLQEEAAGAQQGTRYSQAAVLVPGRAEWRPAPLAKPRIDGPHMATVVGPPGEEIYCDSWGRVKVSFPWDRESENNEFSSCWVRVSQGWAGGSWGSMAIPRIGQDVIIQYVNADPDQPMITGRTYCGNQLPPYDLPEHKTRMTIKSQTHKGGGYNELRFEDELGRQEVFIHAERDQNNVVKHNETTQVGNDRAERVEQDETISIGRDRREDVAQDESLSIGQNRVHEIGNDDSLSIGRTHTIVTGQDRIEKVGNHRQDFTKANHTVEIGGHLEQVVAGHNLLQTGEAIRHTTKVYDIQVSESLTIRSPGGLLRIDGAGVTLDGVALAFRGPVSQQAVGSQRTTSTAGIPEPGEPICLSCMLKAIADGHNMIRMGGTH
ncbi:type VI secretion system tip protein TssI/VgrG [Pseudomonas sp. P1B16]|jgi:type VI secretion system secreted protein VgrG|uniref:type VI secretion system Vgr family protein n=1 Tax=unclassified Pseudomonas TaxID=196821 RepID=UPI00051485F4|nr:MULTISPECIES: type VI secretion system tip protein TssI/VgrG [unclassified Pseudomonas]KGI92640.1 type VI secretion protein VgrG [Pseudomonas sp. H2]MDD2064345.1 type VI secretion system tip protein VgrG [Pseudomonas sp. 25571]UDU78873.1 type VI secretion system tip protein VgrG [Pseudomonas sp. HN2-3]UPL08588.1 type VI secretion system Vgr family protein VgrG [Pseudomonas sp. IsoF]WPM28877.1 type VI secretion system tip protein TssI/VgrG [Pseudomonas sp. P1B16]